ncbi:DUF4148 domain-containing protein [Comamonas sp. GB3 AK4-5]|uniref:DUF4148 domain-containing protein n=1 Tax=Comamonas sp. GB3 AK4-5 TaxID=3231487 RepID=UPI00351E0C9E
MKNIHTLGLAAALSLAALGAQAAGVPAPQGEQPWPPTVESHSTLTRAEVVAELQAARQQHRMAMNGNQVQLRADELAINSAVSREAVRAETQAALKEGSIVWGE